MPQIVGEGYSLWSAIMWGRGVKNPLTNVCLLSLKEGTPNDTTKWFYHGARLPQLYHSNGLAAAATAFQQA
jgi:hypothetical protein